MLNLDMTHDIGALCAALDRDDRTAILILADALEESGHWRLARGLHLLGDREPGMWPVDRCGWRIRWDDSDTGLAAIPVDIWSRLPEPIVEHRGALPNIIVWAFYVSPSLAYLALAEALVPVNTKEPV